MTMEKLHKVLVTGATGFIGQALCRHLLDSGIEVLAAVRSHRQDIKPGGKSFTQIEMGEVHGNTDWSGALAGVDVIFHLAARVHVLQEIEADPLSEFRRINVEGTEHLARCAAARGVRRLVYISSIGVNGAKTLGAQRFSESDIPAPQGGYAVSKWEAEQALHRVTQETGFEVVVIRPPLVYGAGAPGNFEQMIKALERQLPLPLASVRNLRDFIYVGNLVDAMTISATHRAAVGQTYLVRDGEAISTPDLLRQLGKSIGRPPSLFPCPTSLLSMVGMLTGRFSQVDRLLGSLQVNDDKIRRELGWVPPYTLDQGLRATSVKQ